LCKGVFLLSYSEVFYSSANNVNLRGINTSMTHSVAHDCKRMTVKGRGVLLVQPSFMLLPQVLLKISVLLLILNVGSNTNSNSLNNSKKVSCQRAIKFNSEFIDSKYVWRVFAKCSFCVLFILRLSTNLVFMYFTKGLNQTFRDNPNFQAKHLLILFYWIICNR
jgi:hypothetical protein